MIDLPEIVKSIIRQSGIDLRVTLELASSGSNDRIQNISLLELAISWPVGVQILLEFGADTAEVELRRSPYRPLGTDDGDCDNYRNSVMLLLQVGCTLEKEDILNCTSRKVRSMFIRGFASRQKRLHGGARAVRLATSEAAKILGNENDDQVLDAHAHQIYTELLVQRRKDDRSLNGPIDLYSLPFHFSITTRGCIWTPGTSCTNLGSEILTRKVPHP